MAISSIFTTVVIEDPAVADIIADGLDSIGSQTEKKLDSPFVPLCTNRNEIRDFLELRKNKSSE